MNTSDERHRDIIVATSLAAAALITGSAFMYSGGMSEPDSVVMAAGMARIAAGEPVTSSMLYGRFLNPGIYYLFAALHRIFPVSPGDTIRFLNILGVISWSALTALLYLVLRRNYGRTASACAAATALLTPVFLEAGTYFHPVVPALALLAGAVLMFGRISSSPAGIAALAAAMLLASSAAVMRNEVFLALPALAAAAAVSSRPGRNVLLVMFLAAVSAAASMLVMRAVSTDVPGGGAGFFGRFSSMLLGSISARGMIKLLPWAVMAAGAGTIAAIVYGMATGAGRMREQVPPLLLALPVSLMWLLWPIPVMRHFLITVPALALIFAGTTLARRNGRAAVALATAVILMNLLLPEILYRGHNFLRPHSFKEPHGTFFYRHSRVSERIERFRSMMRALSGRAVEMISETGDRQRPRTIIVPVSWEMYGYASYCLAGTATHAGTFADPSADVRTYTLEAPGLTINLVCSGGFDLDRIDAGALGALGRTASAGSTVIIPRELKDTVAGRLPEQVQFEVY